MKSFALLILGVLIGNSALKAVPAITFNTSLSTGTPISFTLSTSTVPTTVVMNFGSGKIKTKVLNMFNTTTINDTVGASQLVTITVSGNGLIGVNCSNLQITNINVSSIPNLQTLNCRGNKITALNLTSNTGLTNLDCSNNLLTSLDVSKNTALVYLSCIWMNLPALDVTKNTALAYLDCRLNSLTSLDVSHCPELYFLVCYSNQLTSLDLSNNHKITTLNCSANLLTAIDLTPLTKLDNVDIQSNKITSVNLSQCTSLTSIFCQDNRLAALDCSNNPLLETIYCNINQITNLQVSNCPKATWIEFANNKLTSVDLTQNTLLKTLSFSTNQLTSIDLSKNVKLESISGNYNKLTSIDLSTNTVVSVLYLTGNKLSTIDLSKNVNLGTVYLGSNNFKFSTLPFKNINWSYTYTNQNYLTIPKSIAKDSTLDLSSENIINGNTTTYAVATASQTLTAGVDYTVTQGKIKFLSVRTDSIFVTMTNATFPNFSPYFRTVNTFVRGVYTDYVSDAIYTSIAISAFQNQLRIVADQPTQVVIYNTLGELVLYTHNTAGEHITQLTTTGIFIVKAMNGSQLVTQKVVVD